MARSLRGAFVVLAVALVSVVAAPSTETTQKLVPFSFLSLEEPGPAAARVDTSEKDAPYVPTSQHVVEQMLEVAGVSEEDVVFDLGSGDGRIPITAAEKYGARGVGIEIDSGLVAKARAKAQAAGVADRVEFRQGDLFNADLNEATVVALYLWPEINIKLRPKLLQELDPGDRIVSHDFRMGTWKPYRTVDAGWGTTGRATIYLWIVPADVPDDLKEVADELNEMSGE